MAQANKLPFRSVARQRSLNMQVTPFSPGNRVDILFPKIGLLAVVIVRLRGYISRTKATDTGHASPLAANIFEQINFSVNNGATSIVQMTGYGLASIQFLLERTMGAFGGDSFYGLFVPKSVFDFDIPGYAGSYSVDPAGAAVQTFPVNMQWMIPISVNDGRNFENGLINLQAAEIQATLSLQCGTLAADFFPPGAVTTGTFFSDAGGSPANPNIEVWQEYYQLPNPMLANLPPGVFHRLIEDRTPISFLGDQTYTLLKQGLLLQLVHYVVTNGSPGIGADHSTPTGNYSDNFRLTLNVQDQLYQTDRLSAAYLGRKRYGSYSGVNNVVYDLYHADQRVSHGDIRDTIDTETISTVQSIFNVQGTLGSSNNYFGTIRRILQKGV